MIPIHIELNHQTINAPHLSTSFRSIRPIPDFVACVRKPKTRTIGAWPLGQSTLFSGEPAAYCRLFHACSSADFSPQDPRPREPIRPRSGFCDSKSWPTIRPDGISAQISLPTFVSVKALAKLTRHLAMLSFDERCVVRSLAMRGQTARLHQLHPNGLGCH